MTVGAALVATLLAGCVTWVASYDKDGVDRITELSKSSLAVYQSLVDTKLANRGDAFSTKFAKNWSAVEIHTRVHLVFEQSREKNSGSIDAANQLLEFWAASKQQYCRAATDKDSEACGSSASSEEQAMSDFVLRRDRTTLERILGAMVKAEEAKKLATSVSK